MLFIVAAFLKNEKKKYPKIEEDSRQGKKWKENQNKTQTTSKKEEEGKRRTVKVSYLLQVYVHLRSGNRFLYTKLLHMF